MITRKLFVCLSILLAATPACADSAKSLGKSGDWESFTYNDRTGKVCYTASQPKRSLNAPKRRGEVYVTITNRTSDKTTGVISVMSGVEYKKDKAPELDVSGEKFELYASGDTAWAHNDKAIVKAMLKSRSMMAYAVPPKGEQVVDTYSLTGFPKALALINQACGVK
jgi:hypothetical protein